MFAALDANPKYPLQHWQSKAPHIACFSKTYLFLSRIRAPLRLLSTCSHRNSWKWDHFIPVSLGGHMAVCFYCKVRVFVCVCFCSSVSGERFVTLAAGILLDPAWKDNLCVLDRVTHIVIFKQAVFVFESKIEGLCLRGIFWYHAFVILRGNLKEVGTCNQSSNRNSFNRWLISLLPFLHYTC